MPSKVARELACSGRRDSPSGFEGGGGGTTDEPAAGAPERPPVDGERDEGGTPPELRARDDASDARLGGGTNARRAIVVSVAESPRSVLPAANPVPTVLGSMRPMQSVSPPATPPIRTLLEDGARGVGGAPAMSDDLAVALYEHMVVARILDEQLVILQGDRRSVHPANARGEEATIVGAAAAMRDDDWVFLGSSDFAAALWRGMPLRAYAHHVFGKVPGSGAGRDAPGPPFWRPSRVASASSLPGARIAHAVGVAWAARLRRADVAALVLFGDGATSGNDFHAGLNFAGVQRAPVIAVCRHAVAGPAIRPSRQTATSGLAVKAVAYGLPGVRVDGGDVLAVWNAVHDARARAAAGHGGTFIEAITAPPRDGEGREAWAERDPIARARRALDARQVWSAERDRQLRDDVSADVGRALAEAAEATGPAGEALFDHVYAVLPAHLRQSRDRAALGPAGGGS
jgi:pyruvate dehydrogenase E1 component alpha subunit